MGHYSSISTPLEKKLQAGIGLSSEEEGVLEAASTKIQSLLELALSDTIFLETFQASLEDKRRQLEAYEKKHGISSKDFHGLWKAGLADETLESESWARMYGSVQMAD